MVLFKLNTGCREREVCNLQWDWEIKVPELKTSVFIIPARIVKNREDRLVVLNSIHVDHKYPLQGKIVSGLHVPESLRVVRAGSNLKKGNRV
jgi:hypothetical protein